MAETSGHHGDGRDERDGVRVCFNCWSAAAPTAELETDQKRPRRTGRLRQRERARTEKRKAKRPGVILAEPGVDESGILHDRICLRVELTSRSPTGDRNGKRDRVDAGVRITEAEEVPRRRVESR